MPPNQEVVASKVPILAEESLPCPEAVLVVDAASAVGSVDVT